MRITIVDDRHSRAAMHVQPSERKLVGQQLTSEDEKFHDHCDKQKG